MSDNEQDDAQKTEDPTPKKLEESRRKGQVAVSKEVNNWVMLLMGTILIAALAGPVFTEISKISSVYLANAHEIPPGAGGVKIALGEAFVRTLGALALPLLILMAAAFFAAFGQVGPIFAVESLKPDISKVSPVKGFQRLFSMKSLMEFVKGILKLAMLSVVGVIILLPYFDNLDSLVGVSIPVFLHTLKWLLVKLMIGILIVMLVIAVIDLVYQRQEHHKKMRMTKQELKDEYKQTEGDPHVKARLRQLRSERGRQRMMQAVPEADVVITNPTHYSIALKYKPEEMEAPLCIAKGMNELALRIREVAKDNKIILYENKPLARALYDTVEVDEHIPPEHYKAVAEVISYVFKLKGRLH